MHPDLQRLQIKLHKALKEFRQTNPYAFTDALDSPEASVVLQLQQAGHETPLLASDVISIIYGDGHSYANFRLGELLMLARLGGPFLGEPPPRRRRRRGPHSSGEPGPHTREDDPETSHEAAAGLSPLKMSAMRKTIMLIFLKEGEDGLTDIDLVRLYEGDQTRSTIRTRRNELERDWGYIEDSGRVRHQNGTNRVVWQLTEAGRAYAESLIGVTA